MPSRRSATSSSNTRNTSAGTATTCPRSLAGRGGKRPRCKVSTRRRATTSEMAGSHREGEGNGFPRRSESVTCAALGEDDAMSSNRTAAGTKVPNLPGTEQLLERYGCGPLQFTGTKDALYERHLMFDNIVDAAVLGPRERYEAIARSVRDVLSQRWLRTDQTYERENPKRVYYLSMEFLIGRSLANNVMNLLLGQITQRLVAEKGLDLRALLEEEPDAGLGNGGLGRLAACFLDSV